MVEIQLFGKFIDSALFFQIVMATLGVLTVIVAILNYRKKNASFSNIDSSQSTYNVSGVVKQSADATNIENFSNIGNLGKHTELLNIVGNKGNIYIGNKNFKISQKIKIFGHPDTPPSPTHNFIGRKEEQKRILESIEKKVNTIVIQGIAGIGKTELAAKVHDNLKNDYVTHWKKINSTDNFDSIINNLAGFLRENDNNTLYKYREDGDSDYTIIVNYILNALNSNNYILFFDDYHKVKDDKINEFFSNLKENLINSTIILTTRETPDFTNPNDKFQSKILDETLEGFDLDTTSKYFFNNNLSLSSEQIYKINKKIGGHLLALSIFYNLAKNKNANNIIEDLPKSDMERYLLKEVFKKLSNEEKEILNFLSCFRKPIESDVLSQIIDNGNVKENLLILEGKFLVKRIVNKYDLHDLIKEFSYGLMDIPKRRRIHKLIGDYYKSQEKNHENLVEAFHHLFYDSEIINDDIVDYFLSIPDDDTYLFFIITEILKDHPINSKKIFNLFDKFIAIKNSQIIIPFILSYGYYFDEVCNINKKESFGVYHKIIESYKDIGVLDAVSESTKEIANSHPNESLQIWKKVISINNQLAPTVVHFIKDTNIRHSEYVDFLKDVLCRTSDDFLKQSIIATFEKWELKGYRHLSTADHLDKIRQLSIDETIEYIENYYRIIQPRFTLQILSELIKYDKHRVLKLIANVVDTHKVQTITILFHVSDILSNSLQKDDLEYINNEFLKKENDLYMLLAGIGCGTELSEIQV
ncbi:MAG: NB-ARC domain-containing protein [Candidatus Methanoperedens sp.]